MVFRKNLSTKYALISVFDKSKLQYLCKNLKKNNFKFISTGSTAKEIKKLGFDCEEVYKITRFKEILDGRVKTLNPKIFGSILYSRDNDKHLKDFKKLKVPNIDIVVANLYPFEKFKTNIDKKRAIEMIDIGGSSLIRASGKNYEYVTVISSTEDYKRLINNIKKNKEKMDIAFRKKNGL